MAEIILSDLHESNNLITIMTYKEHKIFIIQNVELSLITSLVGNFSYF